MKKNAAKIWESSPDPRRARHFFELLSEKTGAGQTLPADRRRATILGAVFGGSQALGEILVAHPDWLELLHPEGLQHPRRKEGMDRELHHRFDPLIAAADYPRALTEVRVFKQREMLRIGARDLARIGAVPEITRELSDVADVCLEAVWQVCWRQLSLRHGLPYHQDAEGRWRPTVGCVLGLGKLGGQELNYSSDVDLMFAYSDEGGVFREPPGRSKAARPVLTNHQFFNRLAEAFIAEATRMTEAGTLYRIDLRLRPEGDSGPLSRSLPGCENYYAQWGQTWERMMLIKARGVAGDDALASEFIETIQPFRYPRSVNAGVLAEVAAMKDRIETEVVRSGELDRNVKLGQGGIREIEFIAQSQQLLHAGRQPFLQESQTLAALGKLAQYERLSAGETALLSRAYLFLRDVEHRLQMEAGLQTHTVPAERHALERLARLMGFSTSRLFEAARQEHMAGVRRVFDRLLKSDAPGKPEASPFPPEFAGAEEEWKSLLGNHGFKDVDKALRVVREFVEGPGYIHVSPRTRSLACGLLKRLLALCPSPHRLPAERPPGRETQPPLSDPDRVATRLDTFISAYGARATLFELWNSNPAIFDLLVLLFDRSEFLAELAIRTPDLVDELVTSDRLRQRKTAQETLADLRHGLRDEDQRLWLRRYHQAELMRIGSRDILGLADFEQYLVELSALAEACLQYAVEVVLARHRLKTAPFAVIGLGKLGGAEIDYGSDLDILFVTEPKVRNPASLARLALEVMDLLSFRTEQGVVFRTDARLRPDGEKGLLVQTVKACEDYYRSRGQLWEIQSLTRARAVAGNRAAGDQFQELAGRLCNFKQPSLPLAAFKPDWKRSIHGMRLRIEKERTPSGKEDLAIKTGSGGLVDAEFVAQALALEHGWREPNTLRALERAAEGGSLPDANLLVENYRRLRRVEGILRRWSYEGETVLPDDPAPYYRVSVRCGFESPHAFRAWLAECRQNIRRVYRQVFPY